jgi:hypothetical protein
MREALSQYNTALKNEKDSEGLIIEIIETSLDL